jgi:cob(I)alamin adenosyltransferase
MGNRLTKIYTRTGDSGSTGLGDGTRTLKCSDRIEAIGTVDELNCIIGVLLCEPLSKELSDFLTKVQHELFNLGSELSVPGYSVMSEENILTIENKLDGINQNLHPLKEFILPGGSRAAALCHHARAVCRRAERCIIRLEQHESISELSKKYLNRLSDYLFVACRAINKSLDVEDVYWSSRRTQDD